MLSKVSERQKRLNPLGLRDVIDAPRGLPYDSLTDSLERE